VAALIAFTQKASRRSSVLDGLAAGLMFLGIGVGAFWAAFLHVVTHAFFKACCSSARAR